MTKIISYYPYLLSVRFNETCPFPIGVASGPKNKTWTKFSFDFRHWLVSLTSKYPWHKANNSEKEDLTFKTYLILIDRFYCCWWDLGFSIQPHHRGDIYWLPFYRHLDENNIESNIILFCQNNEINILPLSNSNKYLTSNKTKTMVNKNVMSNPKYFPNIEIYFKMVKK